MEQARLAAARYPTVATALAAGYEESTPYVPCIGAHYTNVHFAAGFDRGRAFGVALRRHEARLQDRRVELPRVPPQRAAAGIRGTERPLAPAQRERRALLARRRSSSAARTRRRSSAPSSAARRNCCSTCGCCTRGWCPGSSAAGVCSAASARSSVGASAATPGRLLSRRWRRRATPRTADPTDSVTRRSTRGSEPPPAARVRTPSPHERQQPRSGQHRRRRDRRACSARSSCGCGSCSRAPRTT